MDLRDRFAARFAAALLARADGVDTADGAGIARRAYDLAEAMMLERSRRIDGDEQAAIVFEHGLGDEAPAPVLFAYDAYDEDILADEPLWVAPPHAGLLDEPEPMMETQADDDELPGWLEPTDDVRWEREAPEAEASSSRPPGPGLARTEPLPATAVPRERLGS
jgi:hypothetical protein